MNYDHNNETLPPNPKKAKGRRTGLVLWIITYSLIAAVIVTAIIILTPESREARARRIERERARFWNSITREDILYDIDYLLYVLEHNFPLLDSIYNRYGADMLALGQELRLTFEEETPDMDEFFTLVDDFISQGRAVGLLATLSRHRLAVVLGRGNYLEISPESLQFYGEIDEIDMQEALQAFPREPYIISTNIIEEGRIGYMKIYRMAQLQRHELNIIRPFYEEIADFEHLIIDVRGNPGGSLESMKYITTPLLPRHTFAAFYLFFPHGRHNFAHLHMAGFGEWDGIRYYRRQAMVPYAHSHMRRAERSLRYNTETNWMHEHLMASEYYYLRTVMYMGVGVVFTTLRSDFSGQLWLLTDGASASAAEWLTAIWSMSDVAIVVGERTRGVFGSPVFHEVRFSLPNTGMFFVYDFAYVFDRHGRPLSNGIDPDHFNRVGMDALMTTLELIVEGAYR